MYEVHNCEPVAEQADVRLGDKLAPALSGDRQLVATAATEAHFEHFKPSSTDIHLWRLSPQSSAP